MPANTHTQCTLNILGKNMFTTIVNFVSTEKSRTIKIEIIKFLSNNYLIIVDLYILKSEDHFGILYIRFSIVGS